MDFTETLPQETRLVIKATATHLYKVTTYLSYDQSSGHSFLHFLSTLLLVANSSHSAPREWILAKRRRRRKEENAAWRGGQT